MASLQGQEGAGQASIGLQQYYLAIDSQRVANISGLALTYTQFLPNVGLFSAALLPALSNNQFRNGDSFVQLKGFPWRGQHWTFTLGDFRVAGQLLPIPFNNITYPEIAARGGSLEATHGKRTIGFFYGQGTISNTPRVVLREVVPQTLMGVYVRQGIGTRLVLGVRLMHYSNDLVALRKLPNLVTATAFTNSTSLGVDALYNVAGPLKVYGEATWSMATQEAPSFAARKVPVSTLVGPILETKKFTLRANYTFQNASYFPVLGYFVGDRAGPFAEVKYHPLEWFDVYASASEYINNVARDPTLADFKSVSASAGASAQLPGKVSVNVQYTTLDFSTRRNAVNPWLKSADQQKQLGASRTFGRHNLRVSVREFKDVSVASSQRQRSVEFEDNFHIKRLTLGAGIKVQKLSTTESRTSVFYRVSGQYSIRKLSIYGNYETGNDLQNRTLLATNTVSTTVLGLSSNFAKNWEVHAELYRNNLLTVLNPESIFVLQGQGVFIPGTLAALNQWSLYFSLTRRFSWGTMGSAVDLEHYAAAIAPLRGSVEGFVMEKSAAGSQPAEGVTVSLDQGRTVITDAQGHFRFIDVPEGMRRIALAVHELPTDFEVGLTTQTSLTVLPSKAARTDFDVIRLGNILGKVTGPKGVAVDGIVVRLLPGTQYTTPDADGAFTFYNMRAGSYTVSVDEKSLPEFGVLILPGSVTVPVQVGQNAAPVAFRFEIHPPEKRVRNVLDKK